MIRHLEILDVFIVKSTFFIVCVGRWHIHEESEYPLSDGKEEGEAVAEGLREASLLAPQLPPHLAVQARQAAQQVDQPEQPEQPAVPAAPHPPHLPWRRYSTVQLWRIVQWYSAV